MKKNQKKLLSQVQQSFSQLQAKNWIRKNKSIIQETLNDSIDQDFRFQIDVVGKRTNTIFDAKIQDIDFLNLQNQEQSDSKLFGSRLSFQSLTSDSQYLKNKQITQEDERLNQKMLKIFKSFDNENESFSQITEFNSDKESQIEQKGKLSEFQKEKNLSILENQRKQQIKKSDEEKKLSLPDSSDQNERAQTLIQVQVNSEFFESSTAEKKNLFTIKVNTQGSEIIPDQESSTKSKVRNSHEIPIPPQVVSSNDPNDVKVINKNENKQLKKPKKMRDQFNHLINEKKQQQSKQTIQPIQNDKEKRQKSKKINSKDQDKIKQIQKKKKINKIPNRLNRKRPPQIEETDIDQIVESNQISRPTTDKNLSKESENDQKPMNRIYLKFKMDKLERDQQYDPFGRMGVNDVYPRRLRTPPLRYYFNEKKKYKKGILNRIILVDDQRGRCCYKLIEKQLQQINSTRLSK